MAVTPALIEYPRYECHKVVWALKIAAMEIHEDKSATISPAEKQYGPFTTQPGWADRYVSARHGDDPGYYVSYEDGYASWSPTEVFEKGYTRLERGAPRNMPTKAKTSELNFGQAIEELKAGRRVWREGWNGKRQYLELQRPDETSKMTHPYIYIVPTQGGCVPWLASQTDMLCEDWCSDRVF